MGKQPAVVIIARHGARLDAAQKDWHTTAERSWDTPLSYGGWIQTQNLGARIATELADLDETSNSDGLAKDERSSTSRPRKKRKVIVHSSPYLRCVQTSIGIAAGIRSQETTRLRPIPAPLQRSSLSRPPMTAEDASSSMTSDAAGAAGTTASRLDKDLIDLKIDAWLGEWLSSGYYGKVEVPPPSEELVVHAKDALQLPIQEIFGADLTAPPVQDFDEVEWSDKRKETKMAPPAERTGLRAMAALGHSMPRRSRTVSFDQNTNGTPNHEPLGRRQRSNTYNAPVPLYSIAPQDTIPIGYVAHARDACVDPDLEWDSQKAPLCWPDGGQYEEEWSTMHRRFRFGLESILPYYDQEDELEVDGSNDSEDIVLVLVTHQAGCNALIRLITGAPALHDVGTASLTMAVRKPGLTRKVSRNSSISPTRRRGSLDLGINEDYDMKIIASTEHLRSGSNPLGLNSPRLGRSPALAGRKLVGADSAEGFSIGDPLAWRSSSQSNLGRSSSLHRSRGADSTEAVDGAGLWSGRTTRLNSSSSETYADSRASLSSFSAGKVSNEVIMEDKSGENDSNPPTDTAVSSAQMEDQATWQPPTSTWKPRVPVRSGSTRLTSNPTAGTGLWGSPVSNPGGVKEGTPHSRGSFGMSDAPTSAPTWGPRANHRSSIANSRRGNLASTEEENES